MREVNRPDIAPEVFRDLADEQRIAYNWQQIETKRTSPRAGHARRWVYAAAIVLVVAGAWGSFRLFVSGAASPTTPLSFELSESTRMFAVPSKATTERRIPLSDGSTITLAPGASLEVENNEPNRFRTALHKGWVRYNVVPGASRTWEIDAGLCRIRVLGTQFTVNRTPYSVHIAVHRGTVAVYPPTGDQILATPTAGKTYTLRSSKQKPAVQLALPSPADDIDQQPASPETPETRRAPGTAQTHRAVGSKRHRAAIRGATPELVGLGASRDINALLAEADNARIGGQPRRAVALLERILREFPADSASGLVALTLGNIRLDTLHEPGAAALAFKRAATSAGLPPSLREQAYARGVEAFRRAGNLAAARAMGQRYRRRFPSGEWLSWIERWTDDE